MTARKRVDSDRIRMNKNNERKRYQLINLRIQSLVDVERRFEHFENIATVSFELFQFWVDKWIRAWFCFKFQIPYLVRLHKINSHGIWNDSR